MAGCGNNCVVITAIKIFANFREKTEKVLLKLLKNSNDPYVQEAAVETLGVIGTGKSLRLLEKISNSKSIIPKLKAIKAIENIRERNERKQY